MKSLDFSHWSCLRVGRSTLSRPTWMPRLHQRPDGRAHNQRTYSRPVENGAAKPARFRRCLPDFGKGRRPPWEISRGSARVFPWERGKKNRFWTVNERSDEMKSIMPYQHVRLCLGPHSKSHLGNGNLSTQSEQWARSGPKTKMINLLTGSSRVKKGRRERGRGRKSAGEALLEEETRNRTATGPSFGAPPPTRTGDIRFRAGGWGP